MSKLMKFFFVATVLTYVVASDKTKDEVTKEEFEEKLTLIRNESAITSAAIRNITIRGPKCKVQIASMATGYIAGLTYVLYSLNTLIPNIVSNETRNQYVIVAQETSTVIYNLQSALHGDSDKLKEELAIAVESLNEELGKYQQKTSGNDFINFQTRRQFHILLYTIYKLKYQALLFDKTNKEVDVEVVQAQKEFADIIRSFTTTNKNAEDDLRHLLQHLPIIVERTVHKFQNWIEINSEDVANVDIVKDVSKTMSGLYDKLNTVVSGNDKDFKEQLLYVYETGVKEVHRMTQIDNSDNLGGQEFIRSVFFDALAIPKTYGNNLKIMSSKV